MKDDLITVVVKRPGELPYVQTNFPNTLKAFQEAVGGYIETVTVAADLVLVVNAEGRILKLPFNSEFLGEPLFGPILAVRVLGDEFADMRRSDADWICSAFFSGDDA